MKLIVLTVIYIAVFTANCRDLPDGSDFSDDIHNLSIDLDLPDYCDHGEDVSACRDLSNSHDVSYGPDLPDEPNTEASTNEPEPFPGGPVDFVFANDEHVGIPTVEVGPGDVQGGVENSDSSAVNPKLKEDRRVQNKRKLRGGSKCKSDIVCSLLGGSCVTNSTYCSGREVPSVCSGAKCKCCIPGSNEPDVKDLHFQDGPIGDNSFEESQNLLGGLELQDFEEEDHQLKQKKGDHERTLRRSRCKARNACVVMGGFCVTNATLCSGRLVAEGCKGTNCQCCVPGTIEAMFDNLKQELQSLKVNLNSSNSNFNHEMQSLKISLNTELQSVKDNMNTSNSNINAEFQFLKNSLNNSNSNLNYEMQSLKVNLNTELQSLKNNMNTSFSNVNSKMENQGCPEGLFYFAPSNQCFRLLNDTQRTWDAADTACRALGLELAMPLDPVTLRSYLVTKYGMGIFAQTWIGGRGDGSYIRWQRTGEYISSSNPLWWSGHPGSRVSTSYCLFIPTHGDAWKSYPNQVYYSYPCSSSFWGLCELRSD